MINFYLIPPHLNFLESLADFINNNFDKASLKVILPTGYHCLVLQNILVQKKRHTILPNIIPLSDLIAGSEEVFKIPSENLATTSSIEEKVILAEIIHNYHDLAMGINQALKFSSGLAKLFYNLAVSGLGIEELVKIQTINQAEHWQSIQSFLLTAYTEWQEKIKHLRKVDRATYQNSSFEAEIGRLKAEKEPLIIAGIYGHNPGTLNFLKEASSLPSCYIIENFVPEVISLQTEGRLPHEGLYLPLTLINTLKVEETDLNLPGGAAGPNCLFNFLTLPEEAKPLPPYGGSIEYKEFTDLFEEAGFIAASCKNHLALYPQGKIAIVLARETSRSIYRNFLIRENLTCNDLFGKQIAKLPASMLILDTSRMLSCEFELKNLFILLKNPLLPHEKVSGFERALLGKNRFAHSWQAICNITEQHNDSDIQEFGRFVASLFNVEAKNNFHDLLTQSIIIAEQLCPDLWRSKGAGDVAGLFAEILSLKWKIPLEKKTVFPELLQNLINGARAACKQDLSQNITICNPAEAVLLKFDLVIIPDFSDGVWPPTINADPWLSNQMQEELNLNSEKIAIGQNCYYFYLLLHNKKLLISRARKQDSRKESIPSTYILKLEMVLPTIKEPSALPYPDRKIESPDHQSLGNIRPELPEELSATDIETLIRNPYSFYAKKILKLKKLSSIATPIKLSEFGNFVHKLIEQYTNKYESITTQDKQEYIKGLCSKYLDAEILPESTKKIWSIKFTQIAGSFIEWDEQRRSQSCSIYTEIKGSMEFTIKGKKLRIMAIADRVEVDQEGNLTILDYKTGAIPTKKDVFAGLSPQLIIEALIAKAGGFSIIPSAKSSIKLIYVKIASSSPYIQTTDIEISLKELELHESNLISLLEFYATEQNFHHELDLLKYNDYKHLARV